MTSRKLAFIATAASILAVLAGSGPAFAARRPSCSAGSTLAISKSARAFAVTRSGIRRVYACATRTRRVTYLGRVAKARDEGVVSSVIAASGPRVAYVRQSCNDNGRPDTVIVLDLKTHKRRFAPATPVDLDSRVIDIVLSVNGVAAWIGEDLSGDPPLPIARYISARQLATGPPALIAIGTDIAPGSLALAGSTLYWTQGTAKSAPLP